MTMTKKALEEENTRKTNCQNLYYPHLKPKLFPLEEFTTPKKI